MMADTLSQLKRWEISMMRFLSNSQPLTHITRQDKAATLGVLVIRIGRTTMVERMKGGVKLIELLSVPDFSVDKGNFLEQLILQMCSEFCIHLSLARVIFPEYLWK